MDNMPHQFASIDCQHCGEHYCPVCTELCSKCGKEGIRDAEYSRKMKEWREVDKRRKEEFEAKKKAT